MFNFFKKKEEPTYDITNLRIKDLSIGFIFDYNLKSWVVKDKYEYDWGHDNFSYEYKIDSGDESAFLSIEDDGELSISLFKSMKIKKIDEDVTDEIVRNKKAPRKIHYKNEKYFLDSDSAGYFRDCSKKNKDWEELIAYEYLNENEDKIISVVQWDEETFEASFGFRIKEFEISNIIPAEQK